MAEPAPGTLLSTTTNTDLLRGLKDPQNQTVWQQYVDRYRPLLLGCGRRVGLSHADAEDVAQLTLTAFCTAYQAGKYDRERGRLRDWLFGIMRNQIRNWRRRRDEHGPAAPATDATDFFANLSAADQWEPLWEQEWQAAVLRQCLEEARQHVGAATFRAFELFATQGWPAERVAAELDLTTNAVFLAKHRVLKLMRELLPQVQSVW